MIIQAMPYPRSSAPTDPHFANTILLLSGNGADGSTTFTDESAAALGSPVVNGATQVDTALTRHCENAIIFDGAGDNLDFSVGDVFDFTGDLTIELSVYLNAVEASMGLIAKWGSGRQFQFQYSGDGTNDLLIAGSADGAATTIINQTAWAPAASTWYDLCAERSGNTWREYVNGAMLGKTTNAIVLNTAGTGGVTLGSVAAGSFLNGALARIRVTKDVARYASDSGYAVSGVPFPRS